MYIILWGGFGLPWKFWMLVHSVINVDVEIKCLKTNLLVEYFFKLY